MRNANVFLLLPVYLVGSLVYMYAGWIGVAILATVCSLGYMVHKLKPAAARAHERYRERKRILRFAEQQPYVDYGETEAELLKRLGITRCMGKKIGWDYLRWSSYPAFRRPRLDAFPKVPLELGDREHLAQLYFYRR